MNSKKITSIYFSPTSSTKKILETIAEGISYQTTEILDLTVNSPKNASTIDVCADLAIIGVPVYSGRVPLEAVNRFLKVKARGIPAVIVVVYGNRGYDDALLELNDIASQSGFKPIAAGAFIAEHSFSIEDSPIAKSRPDVDDLQKAKAFGEKIALQLQTSKTLNQLSNDDIPGNNPYLERKNPPPFAPETDKEKCGSCHKCVVVCPTGAISKKDNTLTDPDKCILCGACVKICENEARTINHPAFLEIAARLSSNLQVRKEPEIFI